MVITREKQQAIRMIGVLLAIGVTLVFNFFKVQGDNETIAVDIAEITTGQPEQSVLKKFFRGADYVILNVNFSNMPQSPDEFSSKTLFYTNKLKEYICTTPVVFDYFRKYKRVEANIMSINPTRSMGLFSLTKDECEKIK